MDKKKQKIALFLLLRLNQCLTMAKEARYIISRKNTQ